MGSIRKAGVLVAAVLLALLLVSACSNGGLQGTRTNTTGIREATVGGSSTLPGTVSGTIGTTGGLGTTRSKLSGSLPVTLRVEGDRKTIFSGVCSSGSEDTVIRGVVPKLFTYNLQKGRKLDCRIQKQDRGDGSMRVILLAKNTTRSVQQTNTRGGVISVSYSGN
ncbi:MAG: hypothetical protein ACR2GU_16365 [Rubrobacteraceae bacterium]